MKSTLVRHHMNAQYNVEQSEPREIRSLQTVQTIQTNNFVFQYLYVGSVCYRTIT